MSQKYSKSEIDKLKRNADIREVIDGCKKKAKQTITCPFCGADAFSVTRNSKYNSAHCFKCEQGFANPLEAYAHYAGLNIKTDYIRCIEGLAQTCGVPIYTEQKLREMQTADAKEKVTSDTFCAQQLKLSGLTIEDVMAHTISDTGAETIRSPFVPGTVGQHFVPDLQGDDMLIYYYDLHGRPVKHTMKGTKQLRNYVRVRYANPDIHLGIEGNPMKYQTCPGASSQVYIPEIIRNKFRNKIQFDTLFLQEGEKKAEKACKHGMLSMGLQGISNIGNKEQGLLQAIQDIVKVCQVRNVVLIMDSDWEDLNKNITTGERADKRPVSFSSAVIKFKQYCETFHNLGLSVDVWWGHVNANENGDKGVDDLLVGSLKGREEELMSDVDRAMHTHDGRGTWLNIHKITTLSDAKIKDFWHLNDAQEFFKAHKDRLTDIPTFKLKGVRYKVENGLMVPVSKYASDADIYSVTEDSKGNEKASVNYLELFRFLTDSGFYRLKNESDEGTSFEYIHIDEGIVDRTSPCEVRDYVTQYITSNTKKSIVLEYFLGKIDNFLGDKKLERLEVRVDDFNNFESGIQRTHYNNGQVEITSKGITPNLPMANVWRKRIVPRNFKRVPIIKNITKVGDDFHVEYTPEAEQCEFLAFLVNTSNNFFKHDSVRETTPEENLEWARGIVNKITAIGYLLCDFKYASDRRAVVVQDHDINAVGQSFGGAGKSVLGNAIQKITSQKYINGKEFSLTDQFVLDGVTHATRNLFIDDIKVNFDFESIFNWVTGPMPVNPKGGSRFTLSLDVSPKMLITTNHAIKNAHQGSVRRRISYMEFSSWYNADHSLVDDFHHMLFDEWDDTQWTLFDNLMAECVMYYLRSFEQVWHREGTGVVPPPMTNIELRTLRQSMGETFVQWADEFYDPTGVKLNARLSRKDVYSEFVTFAGNQGHAITRSNIKNKIIEYCRFKGYDFNINKPMETRNDVKIYYNEWKPTHPLETFVGIDDKSGGVEYFTVYSPEKNNNTQTTNPF